MEIQEISIRKKYTDILMNDGFAVPGKTSTRQIILSTLLHEQDKKYKAMKTTKNNHRSLQTEMAF